MECAFIQNTYGKNYRLDKTRHLDKSLNQKSKLEVYALYNRKRTTFVNVEGLGKRIWKCVVEVYDETE